MTQHFRMTVVFAAFFLISANAWAGEFEQPPSFNPGKLFGGAAQGPGYKIVNPVRSDGYMRDYAIETPYGILSVGGDEMLLMRIKELAALAAMDQTTNSQEFTDALVKAGVSPVQFAGNLVANPVGTVKNTVTGVGKLFGGIASGIKNAGKSQDSAVASVSGAAKQKRLIAFQYGVDPYTDFKPLADRLNKLAGAAALGGLAVTAAFIAIPGAAGTVVSNVSTANTLNGMVRDSSAAQLMDMNKKKLGKLGIHRDLVDELLSNRHYTPVDTTVMVDALTRMGKQRQMDVMVARAASADGRDVAYFIRKRIELTATYQEKTGQLTGFILLGNSPFPMSTTSDNGIVGVFPIDILSWTENTSAVLAAMTSAAQNDGITGPKVLHISGTTTALAKKNLKALGWEVQEGSGN
jgi:hypothetical protein